MKFKCLLIMLTLFSIPGCKSKQQSDEAMITVSILPQKYFVDKISGGSFKVNVMVPPGNSPATYEPTSKQMIAVSKSKLYFKVGYLPFELAHMEAIESLSKNLQVVDTSKGLKLLKGVAHSHADDHNDDKEQHDDHDHHDEKEKYHKKHNSDEHSSGIDPHTWLSPKAVKIMSEHIYKSLVKTDEKNSEKYKKNYLQFVQEIDKLDNRIKKILKRKASKKFIVFHPAWTYFAADYNLVQIPIEVDGKSPGAKHLQEIIEAGKRDNIKVVFVQKQFPESSARAIAGDIGGKVVKLDPLAEDWLNNMVKIAEAFSKELH